MCTIMKKEEKPIEKLSNKKRGVSLRRTVNLADPNSMTKNQLLDS